MTGFGIGPGELGDEEDDEEMEEDEDEGVEGMTGGANSWSIRGGGVRGGGILEVSPPLAKASLGADG